jgi:chromosome segregation ATPase
MGVPFTASFTIPDWAVPEQPGQAVLWVGDAVVPVPVPGTNRVPVPAPASRAPVALEPPPAPAVALDSAPADVARLRGALAEARSELERRRGAQSGLESALAELRTELARLTAAVGEQREEFERRLAAADAVRDELRAGRAAARAELDAARTERDGARGEREAAREALSRARAEADQELADVRARGDAQAREHGERVAVLITGERRRAEEAATLREQLAAAHVARDAALGEAGGLRAELERLGSELAALHEQGATAGTDLSEAQQLLADARALTEQLRGESRG